MKKIINIDSQLLSSIQTCEEKTNLKFLHHIVPQQKSSALEKGELIHLPLEVYYSLMGNNCTFSNHALIEIISEGFSSIEELQLLNTRTTEHRRIKIIDKAVEYARFKATRLSISPDECEEVIFQFTEYCRFYENEEWNPLTAEGVGSKILFDSEELQIIYTFKIDLITEDQHGYFPVDHKSSSRRQDPSSMSNQFIGYCWALDCNRICINTIGFQKTLTPKERFQRHFLDISDDRIREWKGYAIYHIMQWENCMNIGMFPKRYSSCKGQFPCEFISICESNPDYRPRIVDRDFKIAEKWDPSSVLEK